MDITGPALAFFMVGVIMGIFTPFEPKAMGILGIIITLFIVIVIMNPNMAIGLLITALKLTPSGASSAIMTIRQEGIIIFASYLGGFSLPLLFMGGERRH